jgi:hypothetical protein
LAIETLSFRKFYEIPTEDLGKLLVCFLFCSVSSKFRKPLINMTEIVYHINFAHKILDNFLISENLLEKSHPVFPGCLVGCVQRIQAKLMTFLSLRSQDISHLNEK